MKTRLLMILALIISVLLIAGCSPTPEAPAPIDNEEVVAEPEPEPEMKIFTIGSVMPLSGDGAVYGIPVQKVIEQATKDLNEKWKDIGQKLVVEFDDGKCNGKDALTAAQNLVNLKGVKIIYGAGCSGETLGIAPFANENKVLMLSPMSSSPEITDAGDYIFRVYPSDDAQVAVLSKFIFDQGHITVALMSENTDYAQALRNGYNKKLPELGIKIIADEVIQPNAKDVRTEMLKLKSANADALIFLPQTIPMAGIMAKQMVETGVRSASFGNEMLNLADTLKDYGPDVEGFISPRVKFDEDTEEFKTLKTQTECDLGFYCAATYDGIFLLSEILEKCGDQDSDCVKDELYATQGWKGLIGEDYTFDENGDVAGNFELLEVTAGRTIKIK